MDSFDLEYNSAREKLIIPEYGRNVQKLVNHARVIEDPELRQAFIEKVIDLMMQMHPQNRNLDDYRRKLWKHVFKISDYTLDVITPNGEKFQPEDDQKYPDPIGYPEYAARFRHYGHNVQKLVKKALEMEDGPVKDGFVAVIGAYMKLAYRTWNKEHYVSDEIIKADLARLSDGQLELNDNASIDKLTNANKRRKKGNSSINNNNNNNKGRGRGRKRK